MATFPGAVPSYNGFTSSHTLAQDSHAAQSNAEQADIAAIATKVGTGASTPSQNTVLRGNGTGTTNYDTVHLDTDVSGVLAVSNGGNGTTSTTGTGSVVFSNSPTLTTPTLTNPTESSGTYSNAALTGQPTISDFTNANHTHQNVANGGQLQTAALADSSVTGAKLSGTQRMNYQTDNSDSKANTAGTTVFMQAGWEQVVGGGAATLTDATTFPVAFNTVLGVLIGPLGSITTTAAADITGITSSTSTTSGLVVSAKSITNSGFTADLGRSTGTFSNTIFYGYSWIAWGV